MGDGAGEEEGSLASSAGSPTGSAVLAALFELVACLAEERGRSGSAFTASITLSSRSAEAGGGTRPVLRAIWTCSLSSEC